MTGAPKRTSTRAVGPSAIQTPDDLDAMAFVARWERRLACYRELPAHIDGATVTQLVLDEFATLQRARAGHALTLAEAAAETGMSSSHLGRLVRDAHVPNAGRKNRPRIRREDLPAPTRRSASHGETSSRTYDPEADAAALRRSARA